MKYYRNKDYGISPTQIDVLISLIQTTNWKLQKVWKGAKVRLISWKFLRLLKYLLVSKKF